ncbi:MAG: KH domain-containing protein [Lachnospiraceae bacterium]|nr:KH domain-containing protein [Lachnospiraceae bacterium]
MADFREFSAKTVEDCITDACMTFSVTSDRLDYEVVSEGSSGFIGIGKKDAVIKARIKEESFEELEEKQAKETAAEKAKAQEKAEQEKAKKQAEKEARRKENAERAAAIREKNGVNEEEGEDRSYRKDRNRHGRKDNRRNDEEKKVVEEKERELKDIPEEEKTKIISDANEFLKEVFAAMKIEVNMDMKIDEYGTLTVDLSGEEMGLLIGKRGQTLDSLQYLASLVVNKDRDDYIRVKVDTEDYRARRRDTLEKLARNIAFKVKRSRRPMVLEPMNPYERRIIHSALQNDRYVTTHSEGEEPYRKVVVTLKSR